jgi:antitoxin component YwqK of YwqJK toxin-antitoxin module
MQKMSFIVKKFILQIVLVISFSFLAEGKIFTQNALDVEGKKTGAWIITADISNQKGYDVGTKVEEGEFKRSRKVGVWVNYWPNGEKKSEIFYDNGRPTGDYKSFYENGQMEESGSMKGGNLIGDFAMFYPDGKPKQKKTFNENGETEGAVIFWYENGQKELEFETIQGKESGKAEWFYENGDKKMEKTFTDGAASEPTLFERKNPPYKDPTPPVLEKGPKAKGDENSAQGGKNGSQIVDGYHKTYDNAGNILMDGEFSDGRLYDGRHYIYDEFGLLDHIEVFKKGVFAGNGVIGSKDNY